MANNPMFEGNPSRKELRSAVTGQMAKGFGAAMFVVVGIGVAIWVMYLLGTLLPPESKEAPDPSYGWHIEQPVAHRLVG